MNTHLARLALGLSLLSACSDGAVAPDAASDVTPVDVSATDAQSDAQTRL